MYTQKQISEKEKILVVAVTGFFAVILVLVVAFTCAMVASDGLPV